MKKLLFLSLLLLNIIAFAQSSQDEQDKKWRQEMTQRNGFPPEPKYPTSPWLYRKSEMDNLTKSFPDMLPPYRKPGITKEEIEEIRKSEEALNAMRAPRAEDLAKYSEFLNQKNVGIFRLFPDLDCGGKLLVNADDDCAKAISLSSSYSFIYKYHGNADFYDLRLKDQSLIGDGFLSQSIITPLGDIELNSVTLASNGIKFLSDFKPEKKSKKAKEQFAQIAKKITSDGYVYGKIINFNENQTYGMRLVDYQLSNRNKISWTEKEKSKSKEDEKFYQLQYVKRADKVLVFRIIRKEADGSITILWKELSNKKAPVIVFDKNEKLTDLKVSNTN